MVKKSEIEKRISFLNSKKKCTKKSYPDRSVAKYHLKNVKLLHRNEQNFYYCHDCSSWHLTSWSKNKSRTVFNNKK